jgi:hypothetical protein
MQERQGLRPRAARRLDLVKRGSSERRVRRRVRASSAHFEKRRFTGLSFLLSVLQDNPEPPAEGSGSAKRRTYEVGGLIVRSNFVSLFWIR